MQPTSAHNKERNFAEMENDVVRIGIIGCGGIANGKHMPALAKLKNVKMVAFCDIVESKALKAREKFGTPDCAVYTDYKKLLEDKSIDVVHVLTPNRSHSFITVDALEAGKHVMCEKPMAINSVEAQKMLDAAARTGKKLTIGYQSRQRNDAIYIKNEADAGTFGDIYYAKATALRRRAVPTWGVFLNEYEQGGGPLIDTKEQGNAWGNWDASKFTVEDSAFGFVVMENGATINLEASWAINMLDTREAITTICGTKAGADMLDGVRINGVRQNLQYVMKPDMNAKGAAYFDGVKGESPAEREARQWINAVVNDTDPCVLPEQAIVVTRILEGIYTSAKTGDIFRFDK